MIVRPDLKNCPRAPAGGQEVPGKRLTPPFSRWILASAWGEWRAEAPTDRSAGISFALFLPGFSGSPTGSFTIFLTIQPPVWRAGTGGISGDASPGDPGRSQPGKCHLLEVEPEKQTTAIDFVAGKHMIVLEPVCVSQLKVQGRDVFMKRLPPDPGGKIITALF